MSSLLKTKQQVHLGVFLALLRVEPKDGTPVATKGENNDG